MTGGWLFSGPWEAWGLVRVAGEDSGEAERYSWGDRMLGRRGMETGDGETEDTVWGPDMRKAASM